MQPEHTPQLTPPAPHPSHDPTRSARTWAIALVVASAFLLAAAAIVIWLIVTHAGTRTATTVSKPADDAVNVKKVSFVAPATLPAAYVKNDQSKTDITTIFYYDDAASCGITASVVPVPTNKSAKDVVADDVAALETQGVSTTNKTDGDHVTLKDSASGKGYDFSSINLDQKVDVQGVNFTSQNNNIAYKQFGLQIASLGYACKSDAWASKKVELLSLVKTFTVKTER